MSKESFLWIAHGLEPRVQSEYWIHPTAHRECWEMHNNSLIYEYDPTDDGPEAVTARLILASHTQLDLYAERYETAARHMGTITSRYYL